MARALDPGGGRTSPSGGAAGRHRPRRAGSRGRLWRSLLAVVALLGSFGVAAVVTAPGARAATVSANIQLRGVAGQCLTADSANVGSAITMQPCSAALSARQNWNIVNWDSAVSTAHSLALSSSPGLCLGTRGNSTLAGTPTMLLACLPISNPSIQWRSDDLLVGPPRGVREVRTQRCLDVQFVGTTPGTPVWLWDCNNDSNAEIWLIGTPTYIGRVLGHGNQCLSVPFPVPDNGDQVSMQPCDGSSWQNWVQINNVLMLGGRCLEVPNGSPVNAVRVQMWTCLNLPWQRWRQQASGVLLSESGTCLHVSNGGTSPGTPVWSYGCNNTRMQGWYLGRLPGQFIDTPSGATQLNAAMLTALADCQGMISFSRNNVNIVAMKNPAAYPIFGGNELTFFRQAAIDAGAGWRNRAGMNAQFFSAPGDPEALRPQGDVYLNGVKAFDHPFPRGYLGFYVAASSTNFCNSRWSIGPQIRFALPVDPTNQALQGRSPLPGTSFAMGGARPLIIAGQKWGLSTDNRVPHWPPSAGRSFDDYEPATVGKPTIGVRGDGIVIMMVQQDGLTGRRLTQIRDAYALLGFNDAVMYDGSDSSTLAVNGVVKVQPVLPKDLLIPLGFGMGAN